MPSQKSMYLKLSGASHFRQRIILSTLSGRAIEINDIRPSSESPGLAEHEASLLRLVEKVTNGCEVIINETGTRLRYRPGFVTGSPPGEHLHHDCGNVKSIGWYLEVLVLICMFGKYPLSMTLTGITNDDVDVGVDTWRTVTLPLLRTVLHGDGDALAERVVGGFELRIQKRGLPPEGGGEVVLSVPITKGKIPPVSVLEEGLVKRVRGIAYGCRVSPSITNRLVDGARGVLNALLPDVYVFTDHMSGEKGGRSPGYGLLLVGETTSGRMVSAEVAEVSWANSASSASSVHRSQRVPEDVGKEGACLLLEEVSKGGVVDSSHQGMLLLLCALGPEEINEVRLGPLTPHAVRTLRHLKEFLGVQFSVRPENSSGTIFLSCIGAGVANSNKRLT